MRVSGGDLCAAEAPIEPAGETKDASKFGAQSEGRDLISGSLDSETEAKSAAGGLVIDSISVETMRECDRLKKDRS